MIFLIANDFGPSAALQMLAKELQEQGLDAQEKLGMGKDLLSPEDLPARTTLVITGMGHDEKSSAAEINAIKEAGRQNIPIGLYADTFDCVGREWFSEVRENISFVFVPTRSEKEKAKPLFPNAMIVTVGNPLWQRSAFPTATRVEVRTKFNVGEKQKLLFCPLRKEGGLNRELLEMLKAALEGRKEFLVVVGTHPGDRKYKEDSLVYRGVMPSESCLSSGTPPKEILPGADLVVNAASGASIEGIFQRVPVIDVLTELVLLEVQRLHGRPFWQPVVDGASLGVSTADELWRGIKELTSNTYARREMAKKQKGCYSSPESPDQAVKEMAKFVVNYLE